MTLTDKSENCPVCFHKINEHKVEDFVDCIEKLMNQNKDDGNPTSLAKNQEAISMINDLLEKTRSMLQE
ncbi:MAG: hypothetical protein VB736_02945 [Candidatus Nitrosopelagicus sp.]